MSLLENWLLVEKGVTCTVSKSSLAPMNALTFDVEDWHQLTHRKVFEDSVPPSKWVLANTHRVLDFLSEHDARATFFVVGTVAEHFPELVRRIHDEGHEVATHGYAHRLAEDMGPETFAADLRRSIHILEEIVQAPVLGHRAAYFSLNGTSSTWAFETIAAAGLRYDSSIFPIRNLHRGKQVAFRHRYLIHTSAGPIVEFPLATARLLGQNLPIAGGGYARVLPFAFVQWGIQAMNRHGHIAVVYFHPYEFEEERFSLPVTIRSPGVWFSLQTSLLKHNWGRGRRLEARIKTLLSSFSFAPLREIVADESE